jgi:hypothetical protein
VSKVFLVIQCCPLRFCIDSVNINIYLVVDDVDVGWLPMIGGPIPFFWPIPIWYISNQCIPWLKARLPLFVGHWVKTLLDFKCQGKGHYWLTGCRQVLVKIWGSRVPHSGTQQIHPNTTN